MMKTISKQIVFSWGIQQGKSVCVGNPWRDPVLALQKHSLRFFEDPSTCVLYQQRLMKILDITKPGISANKRVLIIQRFSGGRVVINLSDLGKLGLERELNLTFRYSSLHKLSVKEQATEFAHADIVIAHHGAALAIASLMQPGSLVIELFNYRTTCEYFSTLGKSCNLKWEQVFNQHGKIYQNKCNGNNQKDSSDDASVDLHEISRILRQHRTI